MQTFLLVGSYTRPLGHTAGLGKGITVYSFDTTKDNCHLGYQNTIQTSECGANPSNFYLDHQTDHLYVCNENESQSSITTLELDARRNFEPVRSLKQRSFGNDACFITSDFDRNYLYVANYGGDGNTGFAVLKVDGGSRELVPVARITTNESGSNAIPSRQAMKHFHCILPCKQYMDPTAFYVSDLGSDQLLHFKLNTQSGECHRASMLQFPAGTGPRHLAYHSSVDNVLYVSLEMGSKVAVVQFDHDSNKLMRIVQSVSTLPTHVVNDAGSVYTTSHLCCDRTGKFLYVANRGHDSIVRYVVDSSTGFIDKTIVPEWFACGGKVPRHFAIDPSNNYLVVANQEGAPLDNVSVFKINHLKNGALQWMQSVHVGSPSWIQLVQKPSAASNKIVLSKL